MGKKKEKEKMALKKGKSQFNLIGEVKVSDFTFDLDKLADSGWQYSRMNLSVNCGNGNNVFCEMMGGFGTKAWEQKSGKKNVVYARDKNFKPFQIDWEDRFNEEIIKQVSPMNMVKVGIEKDANDNTFDKKFLSEYDAIEYLSEHLEDGAVVNIKGNLVYSIYNDNIQVKKEVNSIFLSKKKPEGYDARFTQSILIDKDSLGKLDKETKTFPVSARVLDYTKMWNDKEVRTTVPFPVNFEIKVNEEKPEVTKKMIDKYFKNVKGIDELAVDGKIVEGQESVTVSLEDIPEDIKELIEIGVYSEDEIIGKMAAGGDKVKKMYITKPHVRMDKGDDDSKQVTVQMFYEKDKYTEEDLILDFMFEDDGEDETEESQQADVSSDEDDDDDWLKELAEDDGDEEVPF